MILEQDKTMNEVQMYDNTLFQQSDNTEHFSFVDSKRKIT